MFEVALMLAHGLVGRQDLPIPRWLFGWGAAAVLVVSFVALAVLWPKPRLEGARERRLFTLPRAFDGLAGALGVALFALVVFAGLAGSQSETANLAPWFIFVLFWVGLVPLQLLFGDVYAAVSPWRAIGRAAGWLGKRVAGDGLPDALPYPKRLGWWPAVLGLLAFVWLELVSTERGDPSTLAILALVYMAVQLVGMSLYGVEPWMANGDAFARFFGLFAMLSPLRWEGGTAYLRPPLAGVTHLGPVAGTVTFLCAAIGTTTFDGFSEGPTWSSVLPELIDVFTSLGFSQADALQAGMTVGLVLAVGVVAGLYRLGVAGMRTVRGNADPAGLARRFVHTLVPIALAYVLAHYFSLLAYEGQRAGYLASNPLGDTLPPGDGGLFGTARWAVDYTVITATGIWYVQVGALVVGHIAGLVLAHDRALTEYRDPRAATRSQYWMLAIMVAFTSLGLWLLSAANA